MSKRSHSESMLSVIIPSYNRPRILACVLPSYAQSNIVREILIVDDGSPSDYVEALGPVISSLSVPVRIVRHSVQRGTPTARNTGLDAAKSDLCFFGEDDVELTPDFLPTLIRDRKQLGVDFIAGEVLLQQYADEPVEEILKRVSVLDDDGVDARYGGRKLGTIRAQPTECRLANALILGPREPMRDVRVDEGMLGPTYAWEDYDFQLRLQSRGYSLGITPNAIALHLPRALTDGGGGRTYLSLLSEVASVAVNGVRYAHNNRRIMRERMTRHPHLKYGVFATARQCHFRLKRFVASRYPGALRFVGVRRSTEWW